MRRVYKYNDLYVDVVYFFVNKQTGDRYYDFLFHEQGKYMVKDDSYDVRNPENKFETLRRNRYSVYKDTSYSWRSKMGTIFQLLEVYELQTEDEIARAKLMVKI